jgi:hypothetical protein
MRETIASKSGRDCKQNPWTGAATSEEGFEEFGIIS